MYRYKITVEYEGSGFCGWQRQDSQPSVQQAIEEAIYCYCAEEVRVYGAGRTDTGVHAIGQVAHFDLKTKKAAKEVFGALNYHVGRLTEQRAAIVSAEEVESDFHARFSARKRHYRYLILNRSAPAVLDRNRMWSIRHPLQESEMQKAAEVLVGKHDFSSFRAKECQALSPVKTVDEIVVAREGEVVSIAISAQSFLHNQVRIMVAALCNVGLGRWDVAKLAEVLAACDRSQSAITAPAHGLYFTQVDY